MLNGSLMVPSASGRALASHLLTVLRVLQAEAKMSLVQRSLMPMPDVTFANTFANTALRVLST